MVLNNRPYPDWHEGLTIRGVMEHMKIYLAQAGREGKWAAGLARRL